VRLISTAILGVLLAGVGLAQESTFVPPPPGRVSALLEFPGPVPLTLRVGTREELERRPEKGIARVAYFYSAPTHTSQSFSVAIYPAGGFLGERRTELTAWISKHAASAAAGQLAGIFRTSDGRSIFWFPLGFGPGGHAEGALLACRDPRFEIVVIQSTDHHKGQDRKLHAHHVSARKQLWEVIEAIEGLVMP
jgi:hypothetical protein